MDLVTFLRARLDEDEARANRGATQVMTVDSRTLGLLTMRPQLTRLHREVEAKRRMLDRAVSIQVAFADRAAGLWPDVSRREKHHAYQTLLDLALPYSDHTDYDPEWKP